MRINKKDKDKKIKFYRDGNVHDGILTGRTFEGEKEITTFKCNKTLYEKGILFMYVKSRDIIKKDPVMTYKKNQKIVKQFQSFVDQMKRIKNTKEMVNKLDRIRLIAAEWTFKLDPNRIHKGEI